MTLVSNSASWNESFFFLYAYLVWNGYLVLTTKKEYIDDFLIKT